MPLHLKKLCVGASTIDDLVASIDRRAEGPHAITGEKYIWITTRTRPKRDQEILHQGASLYWVINRVICVRQEIIDFRCGTRSDGVPCTHIDLDFRLHLVKPRPHRPFQGWRYLEEPDAPLDLVSNNASAAVDDDQMPSSMTRELVSLGLL